MTPDLTANADVWVTVIMAGAGLAKLTLKRAGVYTGSSAELEGLALLRATDDVMYARVVWARLGREVDGPTHVLCDAAAALKAAGGINSVARLKHTLRRAGIVHKRVEDGDVTLTHVPDAVNVVDMFTKWIALAKVEASLAYLTNSRAREAHECQDPAVAAQLLAAKGHVLHVALAQWEAALDTCEMAYADSHGDFSEA
jgi:hypothetical protein